MKFYFDYLLFLIILYASKLIDAQVIVNNSFETSTVFEEENMVVAKRSPSKEAVYNDQNSQYISREKRRSLDDVGNSRVRNRSTSTTETTKRRRPSHHYGFRPMVIRHLPSS
uniref:Uncharacterized protein n=1 Tax=Strongyloides venezuelensis TaxID=75913 RepID=A0A0K0G4F9_STRVS